MTADGQPIGESDLHAYVDGLLDADRKKSVEAYLAEHSEWAARVSAWQSGRDKLRRAFALESESSVPASLNIARLLELRADRRWAPARVAAGLVLALATGAAAGWMARGAQTPTGLTGLTLQAASVHRMFASDPGFPATFRAADMADLVAYLGQRFGRPITPPDLSRSGYRLMGTRIVATEEGAGCIFVYEGDIGSRISLFMRPMHDQDFNAVMRPVDAGGMSGFAWARRGLGFSLVSSTPLPDLHSVAQTVDGEMGAGTSSRR
jgi:anti-sigma factor RsiW